MTFLQLVTAAVGLLLLSVSYETHTDQNLYFALMIGDHEAGAARMAVEDALNEINKNISGYKLKYTESQVKCNRTAALTELFSSIFHSPHDMVAIIGAGCSIATQATAEISHYYNITQISCASSSDELSDRVRFPYYFQLLPSEVNLARVFYSIIKEYGWRRVALIVQNEHSYRAAARSLIDLCRNESSITYSEKIMADDALSADVGMNLFDSQERIFIIFTDSTNARRVICEAHRLGMKYPKHLFLTYGSYESHWWAVDDNQIQCIPQDMVDVLKFSLSALHYPSPSHHMENNHVKDKKRYRVVSHQLEVYYQCYDATWVLALAIDKAIEEFRSTNGIRNVNFDYSNNTLAQLMKTHLDATSYTGSSGPVRFDENGIRRVAELRVLQYRTSYVNGTPLDINTSVNATLDQLLGLVEVAYVGGDGAHLEFLEANESIWPSLIPHDGLPKSKSSIVNFPGAMTVVLLNVGGLAFALFCLLFNIKYRNRKLIRLNSPNLNYLMIAGIILLYCSAISFTIPTTSPPIVVFLCFNRIWLLSCGYFCGFGTIVAKLWRIYYIFRNPKVKKNGLQDWRLMVFVLVLLLMNVVVMSIHILLEGLIARFNVTTIPNIEMPDSFDGELEIPTRFFFYQCSSHPWIRYLMIAIIFSGVMTLQICAIYLAFRTRKVKVKGLNDAKYAALVVYITTIMMIIAIITMFIFSNYISANIIIYGAGLCIGSTILLAIVFVPKMLNLLKDPEGETVFTAHEEALQGTIAVGRLINDDLFSVKRKMKEMEDAVAEYRRITGLDLLSKSQLTASVSMMNLCTNDGNQFTEELRSALRQRCNN